MSQFVQQRHAGFLSPGLVLVHLGFVLTGVVTTLLGPVLPVLAARWALDDARAGYLFTAQFIGSMAGVALSTALLPRRGFRFSLLFGMSTMAAGVGSLALATWVAGLASVFCYGIGLGVVIPATNLFIAAANPGRRAAALNLLNLAWGIGAVGWPGVVSLFNSGSQLGPLLLALAVALAAVSLGITSLTSLGADTGSELLPSTLADGAHVPRPAVVPLLAAVFFLYVGTENALGGWMASYAGRLGSPPGSGWMLTPSIFWGALLLGRAVAPSILWYVTEIAHTLAGLILAVLGVTVLLAAETLPAVAAGAALAGFGLAPVFPLAVAMLSHRFGPLAGRVAGWMFAAGGLGGATLPWLVGFLSTRGGGLKTGLLVPLLGSLAMVVFYLSVSKGDNGSATHAAS